MAAIGFPDSSAVKNLPIKRQRRLRFNPWARWAGFGGCVYLGLECSVRQRVPLGAGPAESLSPENESMSGSTEGPKVLREAPPLWWAPHNPPSPGCFRGEENPLKAWMGMTR